MKEEIDQLREEIERRDRAAAEEARWKLTERSGSRRGAERPYHLFGRLLMSEHDHGNDRANILIWVDVGLGMVVVFLILRWLVLAMAS